MMRSFSFVTMENISNLPERPGVYCFVDAKGNYLYIGKALNIQERIKSHLQNKGFKESQWLKVAKKVGFIETQGEIEALLLEAKLIKKLRPSFNVMWRDDKNFFYVAITKEELPKVLITHQLKAKNSKLTADYLGPFVDGKALKITLRYLRRIFPFYTQKKHPKVPCQWCQLGLCPGPNPNPKEYKKNIRGLSKVLEGKKSVALKNLEKEMEKAAQKKDFEKAADLRDKIFALQRVLANAKIFSHQEKELYLHPWQNIQRYLKKIFNLKSRNLLERIEAYDISNLQGKMATGSMVVFLKGQPYRQGYRHFKIKSKQTPDDFAMLKEVLSRRFKHSEWQFPDVILIDGGKPQLTAAKQALKSILNFTPPKLMALAKKTNQLYLQNRKSPLKLSNLPKELSNFLLHIRDEAHRFAISYHKKLREKYIKNQC